MTKREHKQMIQIVLKGSFKNVYYCDIYCGQYSKSFTSTEIKEDVYNELKERDLLLK